MSKRKVLLASILLAASLTATGCGGGGGGGSATVDNPGVVTPPSDNSNNEQVSTAQNTYNSSTDIRIAGALYREATYDATSDAPPPVPVIKR